MSFLAARKPAFDPPPKPRFFGSAITRTEGNRSLMSSTLPSEEALSTTMTSFARMIGHRLHDGRQILIEEIATIPVRDYDRSGRAAQASCHENPFDLQTATRTKSAMAIAAIGIRIRSGERSKRGR